MAYPAIPDADIDPDSPGKEKNFKSWRDRDNSLRTNPFYYDLAEVTETGQTFVVKDSFRMFIPEHALKVILGVQLKIDSSPGGETADARIRINGGTVGTTITTTSTTYVEVELDLTPLAGEKDGIFQIDVELLVSTAGRTASLKADKTNLRSRTTG